jgi:hypothetical protein
MRRTLFAYKRRGMDTAEIRGVQIAEALGCDSIQTSELTPDIAGKYEAIVYVKFMPDASVMEQIRKRNVVQIVDALDEYRWRKLKRTVDFTDYYIGANQTHALYLQKTFGRPAVELHHHHTNFDEQHIPFGRTPPTLGYIAGDAHWPQNKRLAAQLPYPLVTSVKRDGRKGLPELYMSVDIGFEWRTDKRKRSLNTANKVVNYMSFGIPSVLSVETGYLEAALHGEHCFYAQTTSEMVMFISHLASDPELRRRMGEAGIEAARRFHIRRVAEDYREFLGGV